MKSKANIKSHPIHPILVSFPIVLFLAVFVFDVWEVLSGVDTFERTTLCLNIAGIAAALIAALPGIIDYYYTVPAQSSAKKRATKHGLLNISVTLIFVVALYLRLKNPEQDILVPIIIIEGIAIGLMLIAGWLGGTLVNRNQIGIDIRYAGAGKWKEIYIDTPDKRILVGQTGDLQVDQMKLIHINGRRIVLGRTENGYCAFDDRCTHKGGSLAAGVMICGTVQCPWHGSQFEVSSGAVKAGPAKQMISTYKITVSGNSVFLELEE